MIPILGFAPDADPTTPGVLVDCANVIPFEAGFKGAPEPIDVGYTALAAACYGASAVTDLSGNKKIYAGTSTKLYEQTTTTWTDRSRATDYTLTADDRWIFAQFGNSTLAACNTSTLLQRTTGSAFADVSGSPKAVIVEASQQGFAIALNTDTASDGWHCSAYLDETDWNLSVSTQCVRGRLVGGTGPITAGKRFGDDIIAYKGTSMFVGRYVGAPEVWRWSQISSYIGCVGKLAVVDTPAGHIFVARDNVYIYDGTSPRPLADGKVRKWFVSDMSPTYAYRTQMIWDQPNGLVWIHYPSAFSNGTLDRCLAYHIATNRWGLAHKTIESVVQFVTQGITYDGGSPAVTTYDSGPLLPYDSLFWIAGHTIPSIFNSSHKLCALAGSCLTASFTTGDIGDDDVYASIDRVTVRYEQAPTTSQMTGYYKNELGVVITSGSTYAVSDGRHHTRQRSRWHRFKFDTTGDFKMTAIRPRLKMAGKR